MMTISQICWFGMLLFAALVAMIGGYRGRKKGGTRWFLIPATLFLLFLLVPPLVAGIEVIRLFRDRPP